MKRNKDNLLFFNKDACVIINDVRYHFDETDFKSLLQKTAGWHSQNDPSNDLISGLVAVGKSKFQTCLDRESVIFLCAQTLNRTIEKIEHALDWQAGYMAWHEGAPAEYYHIWPKEI